MIESNIINWIELGDSMQKLDVYGKKRMITLFNFLRILMTYNSFSTFFFIILHFIFFIQLAMLSLVDISSEHDWIIKVFLFFKNVFLFQEIISGPISYKVIITIVSAVTLIVIGCSIFLMVCIFKDSTPFKMPITILNIIIILLIYYIIGPIVNICLLFAKCSNGIHEYLEVECFKNSTHLILSIVSVINLIFYLLFSLAMSLYYNEIGTLSNANVKTRINCNYEIYSNIGKIIIFIFEYIVQFYGNNKKIYKAILDAYIFLNCVGFSFYVYKTVLFHDERMNMMVHFGWVFTAWFVLGIFVKNVLNVEDITAFIIIGWIILGIIYNYVINFRKEFLITDFNILDAKELKDIELFKGSLLNLLFENSLKSKIYLNGYIKKFEEHIKTTPELNEKYQKLVNDKYLNKTLNAETTIPIYAIIYIIYEYHIKHADLKLDIALNMCYFLINKLKNPTYAIELCSSLSMEGYKHLYFKFMLMEGIKDYLVNKINKSNDRTSIRHVQIGSVILYNIYIDMFKIKLYDATTSQIDYFDILKTSVTTSKSTQNFLKVGETILKIRNDILTLWNKIVELNPFSDEIAKDYMLYLQSILQDDVFAVAEAKKYYSLKNNRLSERNSVYHQMFMTELSSIILIDGHNNNGKILYMTPNFPNLFMFSGRELLNTAIDDLLPDTIKTFHRDLIENAIKFSNLNFLFKNQREFLLKGKNGGLFNVEVFIKCIPNLSFGLIYIGYITKIQDHSFVIVLDKDLNINGFTEMNKSGMPFTMNNNYGLTQSLYGHHIGTVIPEILLQMEYKNDKFIVPKNEMELKGNLYPVSTWKELDHKVDACLLKIKENGALKDKDDDKKDTIKEYDRLIHEIVNKYPNAYSVFYKISTRNFIDGKYSYHRLVITNDLVNLNENSVKDLKSNRTSMNKQDNEITENINDNLNNVGTSKGIKFKILDNGEKEKQNKEEDDKKNEEDKNNDQNNNDENNLNENNINDNEDIIADEKKESQNKNKEVNKRILKNAKNSEDSSLLTKISVEMAGFNRLKTFILNKKETANVKLMKILTFVYGVISIAFLIYDSIQNKNNLSDMGEYLKENLYFNHSKISIAILYFSGLNLKWYKDGHINNTICPNENCRDFYTSIMVEAINDIKTQKENISSYYEDFREILKQEQVMELVLYNLNYTDKITIDTDNLLNLLVFNGLKLKAGLDTYFDGSINGVFDVASSNLLSQSLNYINSNISSFRDDEKKIKIKDNFTLIPIALICVAIFFVAIIICFIYLIMKIYSNEIYFLEKLINFNSSNFDVYLKSLEDIKKKLRLENEEDEEKDDDMDMESKKDGKDDDENSRKRKNKEEIEQKNEERKRKKKEKKSNKYIQVKQKKKRIMGLFFFKWNLFFTIKILIILIISISYYLVSNIINSQNKSSYLDFDQTTDSIEAVYKQTYDLFLTLKVEMETFEERMRIKIDAINEFANNTLEEYSYTLENGTKITCKNEEKNCNISDKKIAINCVKDKICNKTSDEYKNMCKALKCINKIPNYEMNIPSNEELTTPKLGSLLMPLVSGVDEKSTETEQKLNYLYNNDSCAILVGVNSETYNYCKQFWSNILQKGMEQGITQLGLSVASVTDELHSLNDLTNLINSENGTSDNSVKAFYNLLEADAAFFQFSIFVEYYLFESYLQTYKIFDVLREVKLNKIKNSFNIILYCYLVVCIILLLIMLYFVQESKYVLNSFLNFVGIYPVKYLMEDNQLYHETLRLEQNVF